MTNSRTGGSFSDQIGHDTLRELIAGATGKGVKVGLLDTGVDSTHPALEGSVVANLEAVGEGAELQVQSRWRGVDYEQHGTACAGILHQNAPGAEIHSICVLGRMKKASLDQTLVGFAYAIEQGWDIINISVGTLIPSPKMVELAKCALERGQIVIAAKDNHPEQSGFPASLPTVIGVDMDHHPGDWELVYRPDSPIEVEAHGVYVDAPVAGGGMRAYTGTSYACPQIAALAARCREVFPSLTPEEFRTVLGFLSVK